MKTLIEIASECGAQVMPKSESGLITKLIIDESKLQSFVDAVNARDGEPVGWFHKDYPAERYGDLDELEHDFGSTEGARPLFTSPQTNQSAPMLTVALEALAWCSGHMPNEPVIERAIKQVQEALASKGDKE